MKKGMQHVYYYGDPPFIIRNENQSAALQALKDFQKGLKNISEKYSITSESDLSSALSILGVKVVKDEKFDLYFKEIDKFNAIGGLGESEKNIHCKVLFDVLHKFGEGVFSFVKRDANVYTKFKYENGEYKTISMDVAIYDSDDKESIKKLTENMIQQSIRLGVSEKDLLSWIDSATIDHVMSA